MEKGTIKSLSIGDLILLYVQEMEGGASMGRGVEGNPEFEKWVVFGGSVYTENVGQAYYQDGTPLGMFLHDSDIFGVKSKEGLPVIRKVMLENARQCGSHHTEHFVELFNECPFHPGEKVGISFDYAKKNKKLGIRSAHSVLKNSGLSFISADNDIAIVSSENRTARVSLFALSVR